MNRLKLKFSVVRALSLDTSSGTEPVRRFLPKSRFSRSIKEKISGNLPKKRFLPSFSSVKPASSPSSEGMWPLSKFIPRSSCSNATSLLICGGMQPVSPLLLRSRRRRELSSQRVEGIEQPVKLWDITKVFKEAGNWEGTDRRLPVKSRSSK